MARGRVGQGPSWWRNPIVMLPIVIAIWLLDFLAALTVGWVLPAELERSSTVSLGNTVYTFMPSDSAVGVVLQCGIGFLLMGGLAGVWAQILYGDETNTGPAWGVAYFLGIPLLGIGLGSLVAYALLGRFNVVALIGVLVGLAVVSLQGIFAIAAKRRNRLQEHIRSTGVHVQAQVKRVDILTSDRVDRHKIWLEFRDQNGEYFNFTHVRPPLERRTPYVGELFRIAYDPAHPGRKSHVVVLGYLSGGPRR